MRKRTDIYISYLRCEECGSVFPIPRKKHAKRENGHIKDLYCYRCQRTTKFKENEKND
jgi:ribosomal protein S26